MLFTYNLFFIQPQWPIYDFCRNGKAFKILYWNNKDKNLFDWFNTQRKFTFFHFCMRPYVSPIYTSSKYFIILWYKASTLAWVLHKSKILWKQFWSDVCISYIPHHVSCNTQQDVFHLSSWFISDCKREKGCKPNYILIKYTLHIHEGSKPKLKYLWWIIFSKIYLLIHFSK